MLMIIPDKSTLYGPHIQDSRFRGIALHDKGAPPPGLQALDIYKKLNTALHEGTRDIYKPDDTHLNTTGYRLVAETLLDFMVEKEWMTAPAQITSPPPVSQSVDLE